MFIEQFEEEELSLMDRLLSETYAAQGTPRKLVHHPRRTLLRLGCSWQRFSNWHGALRLLPLPAG
jgi:hypothetical protein